MQQILKDWAPALDLFTGLGGLQLTPYDGLSDRMYRMEARLDNLESGFADIRERLARLETHLTIPTSATDPASMAANWKEY